MMHPKWAVMIICFYEAFSIATGRTPTVTELCKRYPDLSRLMCVGLAMHLNDY